MSIPGILAITQVVLNAIVFMCSICSGWCFRGQPFFIWAELVSSIGFWVSLTLFLLQFINQLTAVRERMFQQIKIWNFIEAGLVALWCFFFFTVFLDCAIKSTWNLVCYSFTVLRIKTSHQADRGVIGAAAFFAFAAMVAYGADLFFRFREWKSGHKDSRTDQQKSGDAPNTVDV